MNRLHRWLQGPMPALIAKVTTLRVLSATGLALALLPAVAGRATAAPIYTIVDLGGPGVNGCEAAGINAAGQVIANGGGRAFLWENGALRDLGTLGGPSGSYARGINDAGQVVGGSMPMDGGYTHAFLYDSTVMHDLNPFLGALDSYRPRN